MTELSSTPKDMGLAKSLDKNKFQTVISKSDFPCNFPFIYSLFIHCLTEVFSDIRDNYENNSKNLKEYIAKVSCKPRPFFHST